MDKWIYNEQINLDGFRHLYQWILLFVIDHIIIKVKFLFTFIDQTLEIFANVHVPASEILTTSRPYIHRWTIQTRYTISGNNVWQNYNKAYFKAKGLRKMSMECYLSFPSIITADFPCQNAKHDCQHICFLSSNNIQMCACRRGYLLTDDGKTCKGTCWISKLMSSCAVDILAS